MLINLRKQPKHIRIYINYGAIYRYKVLIVEAEQMTIAILFQSEII